MKTVVLLLLLGHILGAQASRPTLQPDPLATLRAELERLSKPETEPRMPAFEPDSTRDERKRGREAHFEAFASWSKREDERKIRLGEVKNQIRNDPRSPEYQKLKAEREKIEEALASAKREAEAARQANAEAERLRHEALQKAAREAEARAFASCLDRGVHRWVRADMSVHAFDFFRCQQVEQLFQAGDDEGAEKYERLHGRRFGAGTELIIIETPRYNNAICEARVTNTPGEDGIFWFRREDLRKWTTRMPIN
jgi:hypothetical protein